MSLELINTAAAVATFFVIAASALAAILQIRHLRAGNQMNSLLMIAEREQRPDFEEYSHFVRVDLARRLEDPTFRAGLDMIGLVDRTVHPEMHLIAWYDQIGVLAKNGYLDERVYLEVAAPRVRFFWDLLSPAIAIRRRRAGTLAFANFEYLALKAKRLMAALEGVQPPRERHLPVVDEWDAVDTVARATAVPRDARNSTRS